MRVDFSPKFLQQLDKLDIKSQDAIADFVDYVEQHGLKGLVGRNKSSADLTDTTKKGIQRAKYAQKHCLWHYHIGVPEYVGEHGDMTSEFVLHYQRFDDEIVIVDMASHPPFGLPELG